MELKKLRKEKGLSQEYIARVLQITQRTYSSYELGQTEPTIQTICKLADIFEITTDELLGHKTSENELDTISFEDRQAINTYLGLNELKRAYIRGEINTIAKI